MSRPVGGISIRCSSRRRRG
ncbi:hypothetical protein D6850_02005 [Roseovarius spongiae]|uniref:Uncharacterized protein n=1 Tax=Roseovarius spongiae TaxID=2320272 RepID=A0A3A8AZX6_9RHOB|nr:hypothetical protein D6850_02005 [Roseovarius spongiae]